MLSKIFIFTTSLLVSVAYGKESSDMQERILDVDLSSVCPVGEENKVPTQNTKSVSGEVCEVTSKPEEVQNLKDFKGSLEKFQICDSIKQLSNENIGPVDFKINDDQGNPWKIRFHFGFTRTNYRPTNVKIESSQVNTVINGFEFDERTSANHYNPANWKNFQDGFRWIDEPSNTFEFSVENNKNAIYLTIFHPKTLATYYEKKDSGGNLNYTKAPKESYLSLDPFVTNAHIPKGSSALEIQNTHLLMNYSVGYGRKFKVFDGDKSGKLTYVARVDVGAMVGAARSLHFTEDGQFSEKRDKMKVQGITGALGHRLEYKRGKVGTFVEQKYTKTTLEHAFLDGKANYDLDFSTITFGVNVDLFTKKKSR